MSVTVLGIDTSNYTTSTAVCVDGVITENVKIPLPVGKGEVGLRQSDAVFSHTKNLPLCFDMIKTDLKSVSAVGYSDKPRNAEGSYMPCFLCGKSVSAAVSKSLCVPQYAFSHQEGHIRAAIYSSKMPHYGEFYAYHLSGGTFELLFVKADGIRYATEIIGGTLDVTAGQMIDRTGVMLGLSFPCGRELERLALENSEKITDIKTSVKGSYCNLSGLQNKTEALNGSGRSKEYIAAYTLQTVIETLDKMTDNAMKKRELPVLFSGGVASNRQIKDHFSKKYGAYFAEPAFSSDNAAGTALLAYERYMNEN